MPNADSLDSGPPCTTTGYNNFLSGTSSNISVPRSWDTVAVALDVIAIGAVLVLTTLSLILSRGLNGTGLRRGFALTAVAGFVQIIGSATQFAVDLGFQFQTPHKHLLGNPGLVPRPIGLGGPELLPSLVQIIQRRQQFTEPATRRPPLPTQTCSSNHKLEYADQKPQ